MKKTFSPSNMHITSAGVFRGRLDRLAKLPLNKVQFKIECSRRMFLERTRTLRKRGASTEVPSLVKPPTPLHFTSYTPAELIHPSENAIKKLRKPRPVTTSKRKLVEIPYFGLLSSLATFRISRPTNLREKLYSHLIVVHNLTFFKHKFPLLREMTVILLNAFQTYFIKFTRRTSPQSRL